MLVLGRKVDESIVIETPQGNVVVTVVRIKGRQVRLGITAPESMHVLRSELEPREEQR
ncbi:MAG: carbon storage regulator [Candidatus Zipacnadales bacterium]